MTLGLICENVCMCVYVCVCVCLVVLRLGLLKQMTVQLILANEVTLENVW